MKIISKLADEMECILREAEQYIDCAVYKKEEYPLIADAYYKLSDQRMKDHTLLHEQVTNLITEYKKLKGEPPDNMKVLYEYLHSKFVDWAMKIKIKQEMYKNGG